MTDNNPDVLRIAEAAERVGVGRNGFYKNRLKEPYCFIRTKVLPGETETRYLASDVDLLAADPTGATLKAAREADDAAHAATGE